MNTLSQTQRGFPVDTHEHSATGEQFNHNAIFYSIEFTFNLTVKYDFKFIFKALCDNNGLKYTDLEI